MLRISCLGLTLRRDWKGVGRRWERGGMAEHDLALLGMHQCSSRQ
jgi:hypothetical protein